MWPLLFWLLAERDRVRDMRREELRKEIQIGLDELDRGEGIPAEQAVAELRERYKSRED